MQPVLRSFRWFIVAFALFLSGCDDERGDPAGPSTGPLEGEVLFGTALITAEVLREFNRLTEETLEILEGGGTLPTSLGACQGSGSATITDNNDTNPATFSVTFTNYSIDCFAFALTLNTVDEIDGKLIITFVETSPGLHYLLQMPLVGSEARGVTLQLPSEADGIILNATTPLGPLSCELDGTRLGGGTVNVTGTLRYEDRTGPLLIVKVLDLEYEFADDLLPKFSDWPAGSYEVAAFGGGGGFGFAGATAGSPVDVFFDGTGGAAFPVGNRTCIANLITGENPCEDLGPN